MNNCRTKLKLLFVNVVTISTLLLVSLTTFSQGKLKGVMTDDLTGEPLVGASIVIKGTATGAATDVDGKWELSVPAPPFTIVISYLGYVTKEKVVTDISKPFKIKLAAEAYNLEDVTIVNERLSQKQKESPLTLETMDIISIKETPATNFYDGMGALKEVDLTAASMGFKIINTRGFNSTSPVRSLQLIDGVDNQAPGLNFSLGNFLGASELDIQKVELIMGASGAMFGPNAFNGVINMTTKNPFLHKGLTICAKGGDLFQEVAVRYAGAIKNKDGIDKLGYKFNVFYLRAKDWEAKNYDPTEKSQVGSDNWGGWDAINIYSDENLTNGTNNYSTNYGKRNYPGLGIFHRTGYKEVDLVDYNTQNIKLNGALHYKLKEDVEAIYAYNFGTGTTVYQGDNRYSLKDILFQQHRIEISKPGKFFIRAYNTKEDAGKSYDAVFTALLMQQAAKSNTDWSKDYSTYYMSNIRSKVWNLPGFPNPQVNPSIWFGATADSTYAVADAVMHQYSDSMNLWHQQARDYADGVGKVATNQPFFQPGTARYDSLFQEITSRTTFTEGGARFYDNLPRGCRSIRSSGKYWNY